jgi:hypothetical protein
VRRGVRYEALGQVKPADRLIPASQRRRKDLGSCWSSNAKMWTRYAPVEIIGFQYCPKHVRQQGIKGDGYVPDGV